MEVERIQQQGHVFYRIWSEYAKDTLAFEPGELMALLSWLQEHEDEITQDTLSNRVNDEMKGKEWADRRDIEPKDAEEQAHQDWSNDE